MNNFNKKIKILSLSYCDSGGGAATAFLRIIKALSELSFLKYSIVIEKRLKNKNINVFGNYFHQIFRRIRFYLTKIIFFFDIKYTKSINLINSGVGYYINKSSYDIVNFHWVGCETISLSEIKKINKPIVWTLHDMWPILGIYHYSLDKKYFNAECKNIIKKKYFNFLDRITYKRKQLLFSEKKIHIISPSKWLLNEAKKTGLPFGKMEVIPNPINTEYFKKIKSIKSLKAKYKIPENKKILLYSSLLLNDKRKGFKIVDKIINIKELNQHIFIFFGINRQLNKNNYHKNVKFIDETFKQNEIREVYSISDVLLFPSIIDNFPNTILEAMSCGLPCVAFDCYGMKEIIEHKKNGYLAKPYSIEDFKKGINYALLNKIKFLNNRKKIIKNYSFDRIKNRYSNFYKKIFIE
jgi:glycosyltransferase involved in cell wall biosynthesis